MAESAAYVLADGESSRMGRDKARLKLPNGRTLLENTLAVCAAACDTVTLVAPRARYSAIAWQGPVIEDVYASRGPLGGIHAALQQSTAELNVVLAVDMPAVTAGLLRFLLEKAAASGATAVVPFVNGELQPLCAVYRTGFATAAERSLQASRNAISAALDGVDVKLVGEQELRAAGFGAEYFRNVNTPADYAEVVR